MILRISYIFRSKSSINGEKIPCNLCSKTFITRPSLKRHIVNIHEGFKPYKCDLCLYAAANHNTLKYHYKCTHGQELLKKSWEFDKVPGKLYISFLILSIELE